MNINKLEEGGGTAINPAKKFGELPAMKASQEKASQQKKMFHVAHVLNKCPEKYQTFREDDTKTTPADEF